ncbi:unnamed protein product [Coffea canephora]|uniref:Uncharacterized protein n=1 Tax=Coffea canephora TaxID=49390 RepID=A0A068U7J9_COFCA|nr:unnamed protein product [Coffea canephora]
MGNVNGREDGGDGNSPSGLDAEDGGEFMGQSPPPSPRASHSPLMFRPQAMSTFHVHMLPSVCTMSSQAKYAFLLSSLFLSKLSAIE